MLPARVPGPSIGGEITSVWATQIVTVAEVSGTTARHHQLAAFARTLLVFMTRQEMF